MRHADLSFRIGAYRPIYLWAGPGTIRMNRVKFMDQPVDEEAHHEAHRPEGAARVVDDLFCNWVHLSYNWGFPPEIEQEDWAAFEEAARVYHARGARVFAYIQSSNCVFEGSFRQKDWYALDPAGRRIYYYSRRYMVCMANPEWRRHLKDRVRGAIERGADGIFVDNLWHGAMPFSLGGAWQGAAGCFCPRCRAAYREAAGQDIPLDVNGGDPAAARYLRWRSEQVTGLMSELAAHARALQPGTPISANDFDIFNRDSYLIYGQDLAALAGVQDVTMIENFSLPKWQPEAARLTNNALTIRNALAVVAGRAHFSVLSYDTGIGFDSAFPVRRYLQAIGEAAACGASLTVKGTEYFEGGQHTMLTTARHADIHRAVGQMNRWLAGRTDLYEGRRNAAPVGLLFPGEALWLNWHRLSPVYYGAGQTLLAAGLPWRVVLPGGDLEGIETLLAFGKFPALPGDVRAIDVLALPGWQPRPASLLARQRGLRRASAALTDTLTRAYFGSRPARRLMDRLGVFRTFSQSPQFTLPPEAARRALLDAVGPVFPRVLAESPVLIDVWRRGGETQAHLVSYAGQPQTVHVGLGRAVSGVILTPGAADEQPFGGREVALALDIYAVLRFGGEAGADR
jgi:hypothetical protein